MSTDGTDRDIRGLAEFIVAKHRSGRVDDVEMRFKAEFARFENWKDAEADAGSITSVESRLNSSSDFPAASPFQGGNADFLSEQPDSVTPF